MKVPAKIIREGNKMDLIWESEDLDYHRAIFLPLQAGVVHYRMCDVDVPYGSLIGEPLFKIQLPRGRRLQFYIPKTQGKISIR